MQDNQQNKITVFYEIVFISRYHSRLGHAGTHLIISTIYELDISNFKAFILRISTWHTEYSSVLHTALGALELLALIN